MTGGQVGSNPYVGPRPFKAGERLYGRDPEAAALVDRLLADRIVLLYSPSGAGKTSLVEAALIPALRDEGFRVFPTVRVNLEPAAANGSGPRANRYLRSVLTTLEEQVPPARRLSADDLGRISLTEYLAQQWPATDDTQPDILIFDQFEEVLTLDPTDQSAKETFFAQVALALRDRRRWALFSLREDYLAGLDPYRPVMPTQLKSSFRLDFLGAQAAQLAIQRPAREAGVAIENDAAEQLVGDLRQVRFLEPDNTVRRRIGPHIEPLQLQVVCLRLWEQRDPARATITTEDIAALGNVDSALADYYGERVHGVAGQTGASEATIREWFGRRLIVDQAIRGQVRHGPEQQQGLSDRVIDLLVDAHLVRSEIRLGTPWYELTHDRLIDPVLQNNAAWFGGRASPLQQGADYWERGQRTDDLLLRGGELEAAEQWARVHPDDVTPLEREYLEESLSARARAEREQRQAHLISRLAIGASIISVICIALLMITLNFYWQVQDAFVAVKDALTVTSAAQYDLSVALETAQNALLEAETQKGLAQAATARAETAATSATEAQRRAEVAQADAVAQKQVAEAEAARAQAAAIEATEAKARAEEQARIATSRRVAARSAATLSEHVDLALLLAVAADHLVPTDEAHESLRVALTVSRYLDTILRGPAGAVSAVVFSPAGGLVASGHADGSVILWRLSDRKPAATLAGSTKAIRTVAFSPDGARLAAAGDDAMIQLWDVATGQPVGAALTGHAAVVRSIAFSPDGRWLASAGVANNTDDNVKIWDLAGGSPQLVGSLQTGNADVLTVAFSPDGTLLASGGADMRVTFWNVPGWNAAATLPQEHAAAVLSLAFSPDGKTLASGGADATINLWDVAGRTSRGDPLGGHTNWVWSVAFHPTDADLLASGGNDSALRLWDIKSRKPLGESVAHQQSVRSVAFSPDGVLLASTSADGSVLIWNAGRRNVVSEDQQDVWVLALNPGDPTMLASGSNDRSIVLWDLVRRQMLSRVEMAHSRSVRGLAFSPDGGMVASGATDATIILWTVVNSRSLEPGLTLTGHQDGVYSVAFSPDGATLASSSADGTVILWSVADGGQKLTISPEQGRIRSVAFSPDGTTLAAGAERGITLWDVASGAKIGEPLPGQGPEVLSVAFSPDGTRLASGSSDNQVMFWNLASGSREHERPSVHRDDVRGVTFSPDGKMLASSSQDGSLILWDVATGQPIGSPLTGHAGSVWSVRFAPDGRTMLSGGQDGSIRFWDLGDTENVEVTDAVLRSWKERACRIANRDLTPDEWQELVGPQFPQAPLCAGGAADAGAPAAPPAIP